jgi:hypothetical protein
MLPHQKYHRCACGHTADRHDDEMPYPCYDCRCEAFELPPLRPLKPLELAGNQPARKEP